MIPLAFLLGLIVASVGQVKAQERQGIVYQNTLYAIELHEYWVINGDRPKWDSDWILNYQGQLGQYVDVPDIRARREAGYYDEEIK